MTANSTEFFLIIGSKVSESVMGKLNTEGARHVQKSLSSGYPNWDTISDLLASPDLMGAVATINADAFRAIANSDNPAVDRFLRHLGAVPHLALVYETVFSSVTIESEIPESLVESREQLEKPVREMTDLEFELAMEEHFNQLEKAEEEEVRAYYSQSIFSDVSEEERSAANARFSQYNVALTSYKKNIEAAALAVAFIDDIKNHLVFRLYVPAGQLFEDESSQLADLFHDWLKSAKGKNVRRSGYKTARGRVIEFYSDGVLEDGEWTADVDQFKRFFALIDNPAEAESLLVGMGVAARDAGEIVSRWGVKINRLLSDAKYERRQKINQIQHEMESDVINVGAKVPFHVIESLIEHLVPGSPTLDGQLPLGSGSALPRTVTINQQFIGHVEGIVAQHVSGDVVQGPQAEQLFELIRNHAGEQALELNTALRELADPTAPTDVRVGARRRITTFLLRVGGHVEKGAVAVLQKWVEQQVGL